MCSADGDQQCSPHISSDLIRNDSSQDEIRLCFRCRLLLGSGKIMICWGLFSLTIEFSIDFRRSGCLSSWLWWIQGLQEPVSSSQCSSLRVWMQLRIERIPGTPGLVVHNNNGCSNHHYPHHHYYHCRYDLGCSRPLKLTKILTATRAINKNALIRIRYQLFLTSKPIGDHCPFLSLSDFNHFLDLTL